MTNDECIAAAAKAISNCVPMVFASCPVPRDIQKVSAPRMTLVKTASELEPDQERQKAFMRGFLRPTHFQKEAFWQAIPTLMSILPWLSKMAPKALHGLGKLTRGARASTYARRGSAVLDRYVKKGLSVSDMRAARMRYLARLYEDSTPFSKAMRRYGWAYDDASKGILKPEGLVGRSAARAAQTMSEHPFLSSAGLYGLGNFLTPKQRQSGMSGAYGFDPREVQRRAFREGFMAPPMFGNDSEELDGLSEE